VLLVDNTNTTRWEYARYLQLASEEASTGRDRAHPVEARVVELEAPRDEASVLQVCRRNCHGVPEDRVCAMLRRWESDSQSLRVPWDSKPAPLAPPPGGGDSSSAGLGTKSLVSQVPWWPSARSQRWGARAARTIAAAAAACREALASLRKTGHQTSPRCVLLEVGASALGLELPGSTDVDLVCVMPSPRRSEHVLRAVAVALRQQAVAQGRPARVTIAADAHVPVVKAQFEGSPALDLQMCFSDELFSLLAEQQQGENEKHRERALKSPSASSTSLGPDCSVYFTPGRQWLVNAAVRELLLHLGTEDATLECAADVLLLREWMEATLGSHQESFQQLLAAVKRWAVARGAYGGTGCLPGGLAWAIILASQWAKVSAVPEPACASPSPSSTSKDEDTKQEECRRRTAEVQKGVPSRLLRFFELLASRPSWDDGSLHLPEWAPLAPLRPEERSHAAVSSPIQVLTPFRGRNASRASTPGTLRWLRLEIDQAITVLRPRTRTGAPTAESIAAFQAHCASQTVESNFVQAFPSFLCVSVHASAIGAVGSGTGLRPQEDIGPNLAETRAAAAMGLLQGRALSLRILLERAVGGGNTSTSEIALWPRCIPWHGGSTPIPSDAPQESSLLKASFRAMEGDGAALLVGVPSRGTAERLLDKCSWDVKILLSGELPAPLAGPKTLVLQPSLQILSRDELLGDGGPAPRTKDLDAAVGASTGEGGV